MASTPAGQEVVVPLAVANFIRIFAMIVAGVMATTIWLSFFPPTRYITWVRGGATSS